MLLQPSLRPLLIRRISAPFAQIASLQVASSIRLLNMTSASPPPKKPKLDDDSSSLGTHNGHFHADEALAIYLLRQLPQYSASPLVRTRDPALLEKCTVVVDVGGEYDPARMRFDHHQRGFDATFPGRNTKLSAAGLVWRHLGQDIIQAVTGEKKADNREILWNKLYTSFVEAFDGNDNGIDAFPDPQSAKFETNGFTLAAAVARLNNRDIDPVTMKVLPPRPSPGEHQEVEDARFNTASALMGSQFSLALWSLYEAWLPARKVVRECYTERFSIHPSGKILKLPHREGGLPWMEHLYECETDPSLNSGSVDHKVLYVLFPESAAPDSKWRVRAVSESKSSFKNRKDLPDAWKGLRDEELSKVAGIDGCVFVHASGFIAGNKTGAGAMAMAVKALG